MVSPAVLGANLALFAVALLWASLVPAIDLLLHHYEAPTVAVLRYALALPFLLAALAWREGSAAFAGVPWGRLLRLGAAMAGFGIGYTYGIGLAGPVLAALLGALGPLTATAIAWAVFGERPRRGMAPALALAVGGAVMALLFAPPRQPAEIGLPGGLGTPLAGAAMLLAGGACWSLYSLGLYRWLPRWSQLRTTTLTVSAGSMVLVAAYAGGLAAGVASPPRTLPDLPVALLAAYAVIGPTIGGIWLWNAGVRVVGAPVATFYLNLIPIFTVCLTALYGSYPAPGQLLGGALILAGVVLAQRR
ncbi:MAG: hypothetical protein OHK0024_12090 [Thalassobaculales bacterium]